MHPTHLLPTRLQVTSELKAARTELMFAQQALASAQEQAQASDIDLGAVRAEAEADRQCVSTLRQELRDASRRVAELEWGAERAVGERASMEADTSRVLGELEAALASLAEARSRGAELEAKLSQATK